MKISALEEYGLRCLMQLANTNDGQLISAEEIAEAEGLSLAYVEKILSKLRKAQLIKSVRGMYGGYHLAQAADQIKVGDFLRAVDGNFFSDLCNNFSGSNGSCVHLTGCSIRPVWLMLARHIYRILDSLTLKDLLEEESHLEKTLFAQFPMLYAPEMANETQLYQEVSQ